MDLDHLKKLVDACIEEAETTNDTKTTYPALLEYLGEAMPANVVGSVDLLEIHLEEVARGDALQIECDALHRRLAETTKALREAVAGWNARIPWGDITDTPQFDDDRRAVVRLATLLEGR